MSTQNILIEVCVDSVDSAIASQQGGADRVELCDNLMEGGTTPSEGAIAVARQHLTLGLHVIIRPRGGDFCYSELEMEIMRRDIVRCKELGVDGVVIGILTPEGNVDVERSRELVELARPMRVTFHRAFDMTRDAFQALEDVIATGADRLLTSGQEPSVIEGLDLIAELVQRAGDRIIIMPGCGAERNFRKAVAQSGAREFHVTGFGAVESPMRYRNTRVYMGGALYPPEYERQVTQAAKIAALRESVS
ncbi:MAG TPA: copper homeostasis protein CutC [Roseiflexaceae bacterium]|nr:copper homeostasis protein CutC [Roseiflexaceae bacterium]